MSEISRRDLFRRSATVAATATVASVVMGESSASAATGPTGRAGTFTGTVLRQEGAGLIVTAPSAHGGSVLVAPRSFPAGWIFRPGDQVMVMSGRPGLPQSAVPLVRKTYGRVRSYSHANGVESLTVDDTTVVLQAATASPDISAKEAAARHDERRFMLHYIENTDGRNTAFGFRLAP